MLVKAISWLIGLYQQWSANRVSRCRYVPTCSQYAKESLETHGMARGLWLSSKRIARCNPLGSHGFDPVPDSKPDPF